ncbi:IG_like [Nesidiocoris tenuis]|uniref:IG_like n=1 Tax=Nesidiocoris tenuis TaxID=355587 RepID=A0ABN7BD75_9HEMI|nr:IG_like [Nesidiocoris tenuis]
MRQREVPGDCGWPEMQVTGRGRATITWNRPQHEGASPIIAYKVEVAYETRPSRWIQLGICPTSRLEASGLEEGGLWIRVSAANIHGYGPPTQSGYLIMRPDPAPPKILTPLSCETVDDETLRLCAQISGYPVPTVVWSRGQDTIEDLGRIVIEREDDVYSLTIGEATTDDNGLYCLEAMNSEGRVTSYCFVSVSKKPTLSGVDESIYRRPTEAEKAPVFVLGLKDRSVDVNVSVLMGCQVTGYPLPFVKWLKDDELLEESENITIINDGEFHSIEIDCVGTEDAGQYKCVARNPMGTAEAVSNLEVFVPKEPPLFSYHLEDSKEGIVGTTVRLVAVVKCDCELIRPTIIWTKDGDELRQRMDHVMTHSIDGTVELTLAHLTQADAGVYSCTAVCPGGSAVSTCKLLVKEAEIPKTAPSPKISPYSQKPMFVTRPCCTDALEGEDVRFLVQVVGDPTPKLIWHRDNLKVDYYRDKEQFVIETDGSSYLLEIKRCKLEFSGHYLLEATNTHGSAKARFSLQVFAKDERKNHLILEPGQVREAVVDTLPIVTRPLVDAQATAGSVVVLECQFKGHPEPDFVWFKDNKVFKGGDRSVAGQTAALTLSNLTKKEQGLYRAEAWNSLGKASTSAYLTIIDEDNSPHPAVSPLVTRSLLEISRCPRGKRSSAPRFISKPHSRVVLRGDKVRFICSAGGYPLPSATWYKDGKLIAFGKYIISEEEDVHALEFKNAVDADAGKYTVVLENHKGRVEASATLQVINHRKECKMPNSQQQPVQECRATEGSTFTLSCHVGSQSSATWYKDGEPVALDDRVKSWEEGGLARLELDALTPKDSGLYSCQLAKEWGLVQGLARLSVMALASEEIKPPIFTKGLPREIRAKEGNPCSIQATISGEEPLNVVWTRGDNEEIPDCEDMSHLDLGNGDIALRITDSFMEDAGLYTCTVYNKHGMAQSHTRLIVVEDGDDDGGVPAKILVGPQDCIALRSGKAVFTATYSGCPQPTLLWSKMGVELVCNDQVKITTDRDRGVTSLELNPVQADDSGKYVLTVYNHLATDYHFASLSVEGVPDPPANPPVVEARGDQVHVAWNSPHYDGGSMLTGYKIEMSETPDQWTTVADKCHSLSHMVGSLERGKTYTFRVRCQNVHGYSDPSRPSVPVFIRRMDRNSIKHGPVKFEDGTCLQERYERLEELGKGRYGVVHRIRDTITGEEYAAKTVRCIKKQDRDKVAQELDIMNSLRHPKLLQLVAAYENPRDVTLVLEYISGGELFERVVADDFTLTERDVILFVRQICEGVAYMHSQSVVHLDLKPENIMCTTRNSHDIKLIDFGLAQKLNEDTPVRVLFGTPEFIAPEIINYEPIGTLTDMWSVGVICYVLLSGLSPFMGDNDAETFANITRADFDFNDEAFDSISHTAKVFISELLVKRKEKRLTAEECLAHRWMCQEDTEMNRVALCTDKLKKFIIRRKWQKTGNAIRALGRMANLSAASRRGSQSPQLTTRSSSQDSSKSRGRQCSERSDSGFSDCSTTGSLTNQTSHSLTDKKFSISEETELPTSKVLNFDKTADQKFSLIEEAELPTDKVQNSDKTIDKKFSVPEETELPAIQSFNKSSVDGRLNMTKIVEMPPPNPTFKVGKVSRSANGNIQKAFAFWNR